MNEKKKRKKKKIIEGKEDRRSQGKHRKGGERDVFSKKISFYFMSSPNK